MMKMTIMDLLREIPKHTHTLERGTNDPALSAAVLEIRCH